MLREELKQRLDKLDDEQLKKIADFIASIETQSKQAARSTPAEQKAISVEKAKEFRKWISHLPQGGLSLPDEAFSRDIIYADDELFA
jgi:predicted metalloendopeptidase